MSATVSIAGNLLGRVYLDRVAGDEAKTLGVVLGQASRRLDIIDPAGTTEPPRIGDRGKGLASFSVATARDFATPDLAAFWLLEIADLRGYAGIVSFEFSDGAVKTFDYGIATPSGGRQIGARAEVTWSVTVGRKLE